jgi:hypothetical protein
VNTPSTPEDWQAAVEASVGLLAFAEARNRGLLKGGPKIVTERCFEMAVEGAKLGHLATRAGVEALAIGITEDTGAADSRKVADIVLAVYDEAIARSDRTESGFGFAALQHLGPARETP